MFVISVIEKLRQVEMIEDERSIRFRLRRYKKAENRLIAIRNRDPIYQGLETLTADDIMPTE